MTDSRWFTSQARGAAVHALVVGVSAYPNRPFGSPGLRSAALGAARVAAWLRSECRLEDGELATIRLLLSPDCDDERNEIEGILGTGVLTYVPRADRQGVLAAVSSWQTDVLEQRETMAFLYAAGHGVQEGNREPLVLTEDAGRAGAPILDAALDTSSFRAGLRGTSRPRREWYVVDCCRTDIDGIPQEFDRPLRGGIRLDGRHGPFTDYSTTIYGCEGGRASFEVNDPTRNQWTPVLTDAFLDCARAAPEWPRSSPNRWMVTSSSLARTLPEAVTRLAGARGQYQRAVVEGVQSTEMPLTLIDRPAVLTSITTRPPDASVGAIASVYDGSTNERPVDRAALPVVRRAVPYGGWTLDVEQPAGGAYPDKRGIPLYALYPECDQTVWYP